MVEYGHQRSFLVLRTKYRGFSTTALRAFGRNDVGEGWLVLVGWVGEPHGCEWACGVGVEELVLGVENFGGDDCLEADLNTGLHLGLREYAIFPGPPFSGASRFCFVDLRCGSGE